MKPEALVLAAAFVDDPLMTHFWPNARRRRRALPYFWESRVESRRRTGIVDTAHDDHGAIVSVVVWEPAGVTCSTAKPLTLLRAFGTALPHALATARRIDELRPRTPHLYWAACGTVPPARRQGLVAELLRARIDTSDVDCFCVATNQVSVALGAKLGFHVVDELVIDRDTRLQAMLRPV